MRNNEWVKNNRTLVAIIDALCRREISKGGKNLSIKRETMIRNKYNRIADRLEDYGIEFTTVGYIKDKLGLEKDAQISDDDIIRYIMDEQNREELAELGAEMLRYDTRENDYNQRQSDREYGEWDQIL